MKNFSARKLLHSMLFLIFACFVWTFPSQAASITNLVNIYDLNTSVKLDITGDSKKDTVKFKFVHDDACYFDKVAIYVNGKKAGTFNPSNGFYGISVQYLNMSRTRKFLHISGSSDNDICVKNAIYKYDTKTQKLKCVLDLPTSPMAAGKVTGISATKIKVAFSGQPVETGRINCSLIYVYKNGTFKLKSNTAAAKSAYTDYTISDGYDRYFAANRFKASRTLTFYTTTAQTKASFTAKKGDVLTLKKIKISGKNVYLQFQKGSKKGWKKVFNPYSSVYDTSSWDTIAETGWFYGAHNRLAG